MLALESATDPAWAQRVLAALDELLVDHAHCEKKAAGTAVTLLFRYARHDFLPGPLSRLAREELRHFEGVLVQLEARGLRLRRLAPSPYAGRLRQLARPAEPDRLVDTLLCSALIEARSCERFALLAEAAPEPELSAFYRDLLAAEARHHRLFVDLAARVAPDGQVRARLRELAACEAEILAEMPPLARLHA